MELVVSCFWFCLFIHTILYLRQNKSTDHTHVDRGGTTNTGKALDFRKHTHVTLRTPASQEEKKTKAIGSDQQKAIPAKKNDTSFPFLKKQQHQVSAI
jgi:hypothetical protein